VVQDLALGLMLAVLPALNQPTELISIAVPGTPAVDSLQGLLQLGFGLSHLFAASGSNREPGLLFIRGVALCLGIALLTEHLELSIEMGAADLIGGGVCH